MSRRNKSKNEKVQLGPPPSHPSENFKEHRNFLIRSLERNDVDMAALIELNKTLRTAKEKILQTCGELVLLDLGCGRLTLINDELNEETGMIVNEDDDEGNRQQHSLTPAQKEVCIDFLLRMKLRRKLCNRLVRRLNRVATSMDGKDVSPGPPPKYGDLRIDIDPKEVETRVAEWKKKDEAKKRIELFLSGNSSVYDIPPKETVVDGENIKSDDGRQETKKAETDQDHGPALMEVESPHAPMEVETPQKPDSRTTAEAPKGKEESDPSSPPTFESDIELLREYDTIYEKVWDETTKSFKYVLPEEEGDPEHKQIKNGSGIGATMKILTAQDRENEHKRWQTSILARIPDQPTFEDLGLKNRVFSLEARRKRCLEEAGEDSDDDHEAKKTQVIAPRQVGGKKLRKIEKDEDEDKMDVSVASEERETSTDEKDEIKGGDAQIEAGDKSDDDEEESDEEKSEKHQKKNDEVAKEVIKPKRPISLAAIPSFYEQDLARIRVIHTDFIGHAAAEQARKRLAEVTNAYNEGEHIMNVICILAPMSIRQKGTSHIINLSLSLSLSFFLCACVFSSSYFQ
jgi:hypothetical protein